MNRSGSDVSEYSDWSLSGSLGGEFDEGSTGKDVAPSVRRSWPLGLPVGTGLQDGSLLHLLEEV